MEGMLPSALARKGTRREEYFLPGCVARVAHMRLADETGTWLSPLLSCAGCRRLGSPMAQGQAAAFFDPPSQPVPCLPQDGDCGSDPMAAPRLSHETLRAWSENSSSGAAPRGFEGGDMRVGHTQHLSRVS